MGVTVHNLAVTTHFTAGDVLTIPDPLLCHTSTVDEVTHLTTAVLMFGQLPKLLIVNPPPPI